MNNKKLEDKEVEISVIVPMYNVQLYISSCIESILRQQIKDIEILLIDDGSTDSTYEIARQYQKIDNRIQLIRKTNGGVSSARNLGINYAKGQYITFVDSDDVIEKEMLLDMYESIKCAKADLCICGAKIKDNKRNRSIIFNYDECNANELLMETIGGTALNSKLGKKKQSIWGAIYKRNLLNHIRFNEEIKIGEDWLFNIQYLLNAEKIINIRRSYYIYSVRDNSATQKYMKSLIRDSKLFIDIVEGLLPFREVENEMRIRIDMLIINNSITCILNESKNKDTAIRNIGLICKDKRLREVLNRRNIKGQGIRGVYAVFIKLKMVKMLYIISVLINKFNELC